MRVATLIQGMVGLLVLLILVALLGAIGSIEMLVWLGLEVAWVVWWAISRKRRVSA